MRNDRLSQLVLDAWRSDAGLAPAPACPTWTDEEDLGGRIVRIARVAAALHIGRRVAPIPADESER